MSSSVHLGFLRTQTETRETKTKNPNTERTKWDTLLVAGGEDDGAGVVPDDALGDPGLAKMVGDGSALGQDGVGADDIDSECVAGGAWLQLLHLLKLGLPQHRLRIALLRRWLRRFRSRAGHALDDLANPNPNSQEMSKIEKGILCVRLSISCFGSSLLFRRI